MQLQNSFKYRFDDLKQNNYIYLKLHTTLAERVYSMNILTAIILLDIFSHYHVLIKSHILTFVKYIFNGIYCVKIIFELKNPRPWFSFIDIKVLIISLIELTKTN